MFFDILYQDDNLIAINKPTGWLVHRTSISEDKVFILQELRDQIDHFLYPVHRIDRRTSGVLIFAKNKETASALGLLFTDKKIEKTYLALVRGWLPDAGTIVYPVFDPDKTRPPVDGLSHYVCLAKVEMPWAISRYPTSRYSLVEVKIETGRRHQIRQHLEHLRHPILGDKLYGDAHHNRHFWDLLGFRRQMLHASRIAFQLDGQDYRFHAPLGADFLGLMGVLGMKLLD